MRADRPGMDEALRLVHRRAVGQCNHRTDPWGGHQPSAHRIAADPVEQHLIPSPLERDSRRGFPTPGEYDSPWQTGGGLPWLLRLGFEGITTPRDCASWRSGLRMPIRRGACWRWRRSTMAGLEPKRDRKSVV